MVVSSSSPAVAARCLHLRAGVGVVASQNITNPALGSAVLDLLASGVEVSEAIAKVMAEERYPQYRQITAVDAAGRTALFSGELSLGHNATATGTQCVAAGNLLAGTHVPQAIIDAYEASAAPTFEGRLLDGLHGAIAAGGEEGAVRSAGLAVVENVSWSVTDLRVDDAEDPISELARLLELWLPQKTAYLDRAIQPAGAPSYGVPGDL
jgi:uncharacterized Ntn-hydrolase superfamily protein